MKISAVLCPPIQKYKHWPSKSRIQTKCCTCCPHRLMQPKPAPLGLISISSLKVYCRSVWLLWELNLPVMQLCTSLTRTQLYNTTMNHSNGSAQREKNASIGLFNSPICACHYAQRCKHENTLVHLSSTSLPSIVSSWDNGAKGQRDIQRSLFPPVDVCIQQPGWVINLSPFNLGWQSVTVGAQGPVCRGIKEGGGGLRVVPNRWSHLLDHARGHMKYSRGWALVSVCVVNALCGGVSVYGYFKALEPK